MGISVKIGGYPFQLEDFQVEESATPLAAGDSFGSTGTVSLTVVRPDPEVFSQLPLSDEDMYGDRTYGDGVYGFTSGKIVPQRPSNGWSFVADLGANWFIDKPITLTDSQKGFVIGAVESVRRGDSDAKYVLSCTTRMGELNVYGVQAQPYVGTLSGAFSYYLSLADITTGVFVDDTISERPVVFSGWNGELWFHLKEMAVAQDCDISLVAGIILLRPIRARVATRGRDIDRSQEIGGGTLARAVEVYRYDSQPITNSLVWPPGGWKAETEVQNVNAGEESEYVLELSASVSSIQQPEMVELVTEDYDTSSVFTIVANDGLPVSKKAWTENGGSLTVSIEPDTTSLRVKLRGATGLPTVSGGPATNFSVALASDTSGNRYSTLRIVGTGVEFDKQKITVRTTVPENKTATEIGVTVDNIFINTVDDAYRAGTRAAKKFAGYSPTLSGSVYAINGLGENGQEDFQVFGNVQGCRFYDSPSHRWYRIRTGTLTPAFVQSFQADDDLIHADIEEFYVNKTYRDVQNARAGFSYKQDQMAGLYVG